MPSITEPNRVNDWLHWEAHEDVRWTRVDAQITLAVDESFPSGTVVGPITATPGEFAQYDPGAADGREAVGGVLLYAVTNVGGAAAAVVKVAVVSRGPADIKPNGLTWLGTLTAPEIATGITELEALSFRQRAVA